jgi:hypothetical protein
MISLFASVDCRSGLGRRSNGWAILNHDSFHRRRRSAVTYMRMASRPYARGYVELSCSFVPTHLLTEE